MQQVNKEVLNSSVGTMQTFTTKFIYNSAVKPAQVDAALACNFKRKKKKLNEKVALETWVFRANTRGSVGYNGLKTTNKALCKSENVEKHKP